MNTIINTNPGLPVTLYDTGSPGFAVLLEVVGEELVDQREEVRVVFGAVAAVEMAPGQQRGSGSQFIDLGPVLGSCGVEE